MEVNCVLPLSLFIQSSDVVVLFGGKISLDFDLDWGLAMDVL
jgi:hypothetical protein